MSVDNTLAERGARYGDFTDHAELAQELQDIMRGFRKLGPQGQIVNPWAKLDSVKRQALTVIADKIARILSGDPNYTDNWHDIQGYAKLAEDRCFDTTLPQFAFPNERNPALANLCYGTKLENAADRDAHGTTARGERVGGAKLTAEQVLAIREDTRTLKQIASSYGVHFSLISLIRKRKVWAHV